MLNYQIEEAAFFDIYSILDIKGIKNPNFHNADNLNKCYLSLKSQLDYNLLLTIFNSVEYKNLFDTNLKIFEILDKAKKEPETIYIEDADYLNYDRFKAKQELQKKFFNKDLNEIKIGYKDD